GRHQPRQTLADLVGAEAADQGEAAGGVARIEHVDQAQQLVGLERRADLETDRIPYAAGELDVGPVEPAGALADPQHVGRGGEPLAGGAVDAGRASSTLSSRASWLVKNSTRDSSGW